MHLATRSFRGILLLQPQRVARAMCSASPSVATEMQFLMQEHSTLPLFSLQPATKEIPLTQGKVAIVDASDYDFLMQWAWMARLERHCCYAVRRFSVDGKQCWARMHRVIMEAKTGTMIDHINGNGLDNRRDNLRLATTSQNTQNKKIGANNTSGYKGVDHRSRKWRARIWLHGQEYHLGYFDSDIAAAHAYNKAAERLHGEFARLNEIKEE